MPVELLDSPWRELVFLALGFAIGVAAMVEAGDYMERRKREERQ